jgi:hypothetical protein
MPRLPTVAARVSSTYAPVLGLLIVCAGPVGCSVDSSGLASFEGGAGNGSGGQTAAAGGAGGQGTGGAGGVPTFLGTAGSAGTTSGLAGDSGLGGADGGATGQAGQGGGAGAAGSGGYNDTGRGGRGGASGSAGAGNWSGGGGYGNWTGSGGWTGSAGSTGRGGSGSGLPACDPDVKDGGFCALGTAACRKACGVGAGATKPCSCIGGLWNCGTCVYPSGDYSCYRLQGFTPQCPFATMSGVTRCTSLCSLCSGYVDSAGVPKAGYCACSESDAGGNVYQCASYAEWPPQ